MSNETLNFVNELIHQVQSDNATIDDVPSLNEWYDHINQQWWNDYLASQTANDIDNARWNSGIWFLEKNHTHLGAPNISYFGTTSDQPRSEQEAQQLLWAGWPEAFEADEIYSRALSFGVLR